MPGIVCDMFWQSFVTAEVDTATKSCAKSVLDPVFRLESDGGLGFGSLLRPEAVGVSTNITYGS